MPKTSEEVAKQLKLCGGHSSYPLKLWYSEEEVREIFNQIEIIFALTSNDQEWSELMKLQKETLEVKE